MRTSREIREQLDHPIVDCDGHVREFMPAALPYLRESLGQPLFDRFVNEGTELERSYAGGSTADRAQTRAPQGAWWATPSMHALDRATATTPRLLHDRLDELGIDFAILYATLAMGTCSLRDDDLRIGLCRGYNEFFADVYGPYADRMTMAGLIPMTTPTEALDELDHCARLGLKTVTIPHGVLRPIPAPAREPSLYLWPGATHWFDTFGVDSAYDYDPVWQRHLDHGYAVTAHGGMAMPVGVYSSITSFTFNHLGSHKAMMEPLCKSLFLGGVTHRFPELRFAFLESGVAWGCSLLHDLVEHWEKRGGDSIQWTNPANLDVAQMEALMRAHSGDFPHLEERYAELLAPMRQETSVPPDELDEFSAAGIEREEDIRDRFVPSFFFGCEADDRTLAFAFSPANHFGAQLGAVFSSDIGHWDVKDMATVVRTAWSLVEDGLVTEADFRALTCDNPIALHTAANPSFFDGTPVRPATEAPASR